MNRTDSARQSCHPAISVVVPVYNAERYLHRCLDGLRAQTIADDLEVILVDDGSTDGSLAILRAFEAENPSARVVHQPNGGLPAARNAGVREATGDYVGFIDADDSIEPTMFETLYRAAEEAKADISVVGFNIQIGDRWAKRYGTGEKTVFGQESALDDFFGERRIDGNAWNKLFSRRVYSRVSFDGALTHCEDRRYVFDALMLAERVVHTDECLYWYYRNPGSITHSGFKGDRLVILDCARQMSEVACGLYPGLADAAACYELRIHAKTYEELLTDKRAVSALVKEQERLRGYLRAFDYSVARKHMLPRHYWAAVLLSRCPGLFMCAVRLLKGGRGKSEAGA